MSESSIQKASRTKPRVEPATIEDLPALVELILDLMESGLDFQPCPDKHRRALELILENPGRGRIFVLRSDTEIIGMVNLLFTISTAEGGFVAQMEDVIIRPEHRGLGYGSQLLEYALKYCTQKGFVRVTLLTDKMSAESQKFFRKHGFDYSNMIPMRRWLDDGRSRSEVDPV